MRPERYPCHDEKQLAAAISRLEAAQPRQIMIVAGAVGSGRREFLLTVAERLTQRERLTRVVALSLDGFEPMGPGLPGFVDFRLAFGRELPEPRAAQLRQLAEHVGKQGSAAAGDGRWAVVFALLFELVDVLGTEELEATLSALQGEQSLTPESAVSQTLARLCAGAAHVLLHVPADSTLADTTLFWALSRAFEQPTVCVAFSCAPQLASEALTGGARIPCSGLRIELPMKTETALARAKEINQAVGLGLDEAALSRAAQRANGSSGRLARELDAAAARAAAGEAETGSEGASTPLPASVRLERWFATLGEDAALLRKLLSWAAACGEVAPILPLMAAAQCSQADAERIIDRLDEEVCGPQAPLPMLDDLAYRHPGFPGLAVYRFRDPAMRHAVLDAVEPQAQLEAERALLSFLGSRLGVGTRSTAQLFVNLAERVQFDLSAGARQRLRLWVSPPEAVVLEQLLKADVGAGRLAADALFNTALRDQSLPPHQRLALLEASAVKEAELPLERRTMLTGVRTELLCGLGRFPEALQSAEKGFELLAGQTPEPPGMRGLLLFLKANCQRQLGQPDAALVSFKAAAEQAKQPRPDGSVDHHNLGVCLAEAGHCHAERQQWEPAAALLREGIAALRQSPMDERIKKEQIAQLEKNLAICEAKLREPATA